MLWIQNGGEPTLTAYLDAAACRKLEDFSPERGCFEDKLLIVGHTPTELLCGEHRIFRKGNFIDIDCGIAFESDKLGCLRPDDLREYYV